MKQNKKKLETCFIVVPSFVVAGFTLCFGATGTVGKKTVKLLTKM